jgi:hypothetical protein
MKKEKRGSLFFFVIIAFILGLALLKKFNFETDTFESPGLAILYSIVFFAAIILIVRNLRKD